MSTRSESLIEMAERSVRTYPSRPVFGERVDGTWSWMSYAELGAHIAELCSGLAALGVNPGDRVAIISRNSAQWAAVGYATYGRGAVYVPMYETQRSEDWEFILRDCGASVLFVRTPEIAAIVDKLRGGLPGLRHVLMLDDHQGSPDSYEGLRQLGREHPVAAIHPAPDTVAGFIYTSGTTGRPKGVMLTHANITSNVHALTSVFPISPDDRSMCFLPWAHVLGHTCELQVLVSGGASMAFNRDLTRLVDDLGDVRPTALFAVPRIFNRLYASVHEQIEHKPRPVRELFRRGVAASIRRRRGERLGLLELVMLWVADLLVFRKIRHKFGGRLKYTVSGGATLSKEVGEFIDALGLDVYEGYGLTETSPVVAANRPGARRLGSVGKPLPGVTVTIQATEGMAPGVGEIVVYGPLVMKGYHARPDDNAKAFTADGGLRTGDLGRLDEDGYLYITGRVKEQYKLENGKYVVPTPLEERLALSPYISLVMLHGANRPYNVALVIIEPAVVRAWATEHGLTLGSDLTHDPTVRDLIARELDHYGASFRNYEKPRAFVISDEELTTANGMITPSLKLKREAIHARFGAALEALYEQPAPPPAVVPERVPPRKVLDGDDTAAQQRSRSP